MCQSRPGTRPVIWGAAMVKSLLALQVHASLRKAGMDKQTLRYFDLEDADMLLYELRFLDLSARPAAAAYIAEKEFNTPVRSQP